MENLSIEIIDTQNGGLTLVEEFTEVKNPVLLYNGADDRFQNIMSSQLNFNMLVANAQDGKFIHLFTGDETRYRVLVKDTTDVLNPVLIWQGHLLPEQFSEPYKSGAFFVSFIATDGLGRLKEKYLPNAFYLEKKSIASILAECLLLTGNDFDFYFASAIKNSLDTDLRISDLALNTFSYINGKKKKNAYDILKSILEFLVCKLFQYNGAWYIVGLNRFKDTSVLFEKYSAGSFVSNITINRNVSNAVFESSPNISYIPVLKSVAVDYDVKDTDELIPDFFTSKELNFFINSSNVVNGKPFSIINDTNTFYIGWVLDRFEYPVTPESFNTLKSGDVVDIDGYNVYIDLLNNGKVPVWSFAIFGGHYLPSSHHVHLDNYFYVEKGLGIYSQRYLELKIELECTFLSSFSGTPSSSQINDSFGYELLLDGVVILDNTVADAEYTLSVVRSYSRSMLITVSKKIVLIDSGYLSLKFYTKDVCAGSDFNYCYFKALSLKYNDYSFLKDNNLVRAVESTTKKEISLKYIDDRNSIFKEKLGFSDSFNYVPVVITVPAYFQEINVVSVSHNQINSGYWSFVEVSKADWDLLKDYSDFIFKKVNDVGSLISISDVVFDIYWDGVFAVKYILSIYSATGYFFNSGDTLWVDAPVQTKTYSDKNYLIDKWSRFEATDSMRYLDVVARLYHDSVKEPLLMIDGNLFGVKFPLDVLLFNYLGIKRFLLSKLGINLTEGTTQVILIEDKQSNVIDYE